MSANHFQLLVACVLFAMAMAFATKNFVRELLITNVKRDPGAVLDRLIAGEFIPRLYRRIRRDEFGTLYKMRQYERGILAQSINPWHTPKWREKATSLGAWGYVVRVKCPSTGTIYNLRVPPDEYRSAKEAVAWTFRLPVEAYEPVVQT